MKEKFNLQMAQLQTEILEYINLNKDNEQVYYKAVDLLNWTIYASNLLTSGEGEYYPGLCRSYLTRFQYPIHAIKIRQVFNELKRCEPLRSRMEQYARKLMNKTGEREQLEHLDALSVLAEQYPEIYKTQYEAERSKFYSIKPFHLLEVTPSPPVDRYHTNLDLYGQYQKVMDFINDLDSGTESVKITEQRFNMWKHENEEQNTQHTIPKSKYAQSYIQSFRGTNGVGKKYEASFRGNLK